MRSRQSGARAQHSDDVQGEPPTTSRPFVLRRWTGIRTAGIKRPVRWHRTCDDFSTGMRSRQSRLGLSDVPRNGRVDIRLWQRPVSSRFLRCVPLCFSPTEMPSRASAWHRCIVKSPEMEEANALSCAFSSCACGFGTGRTTRRRRDAASRTAAW